MSKCILSGLEIPKNRESLEHLVPRSRAPYAVINNPANIFPAHKILNCMKGDLLPCEFQRLKYDIAYKAIHKWDIKRSDIEFVRKSVANWEGGYNPDWCNICLLNCKGRQR